MMVKIYLTNESVTRGGARSQDETVCRVSSSRAHHTRMRAAVLLLYYLPRARVRDLTRSVFHGTFNNDVAWYFHPCETYRHTSASLNGGNECARNSVFARVGLVASLSGVCGNEYSRIRNNHLKSKKSASDCKSNFGSEI